MKGDSNHTIYNLPSLQGATLHRFLNPAGVPYSAIYIGSDEVLNTERNREKGMIEEFIERLKINMYEPEFQKMRRG